MFIFLHLFFSSFIHIEFVHICLLNLIHLFCIALVHLCWHVGVHLLRAFSHRTLTRNFVNSNRSQGSSFKLLRHRSPSSRAGIALPVLLMHAFSSPRDSMASIVVNPSHARHPLQVPRVLPIYVTGKKGWWSWRGSSRQKKLILQIWPPNVFGVFFCPNHAMAVLLPMLCYHVPARWVAFAACLWKNWQQTEWNKEKLGVNGAPSHVICYGLGVSLSKWLQRGQVIKIGLFQLGLNLFHRRFRLFLAARSRYLPTVLLELHPLLLMPTVVIF